MADPTIFSYSLRDANGILASTRAYAIYNGAVETVDALIGVWSQLGGLLDAATNAVIEGGNVTIPLIPNAAWKDAPVDENDVSDIITLNMSNAVTSYVWGFILPNFPQNMITAGGQVDLANAPLTALYTLLAGSFTNGAFSNTSGQDLQALANAFQSDRKHRKQIVSRSKVYP